ncbi:hypothetical protein [Kitasatospora cineracea]|uniref:hypothetical protein n=1 Tax=Kitasatospora cineracea TaxID=88074 RepID=UPI0033C8D555
MSLNRENVTWQTENGTWSIGFYDYEEPCEPDEDYSYEWDVEYTRNRFGWLSTGHPDWGSAMAAYCEYNANPGGGTILRRTPDNAAEIARCEELAAAYNPTDVTGDFWSANWP